jgi:AcrR family transcriptional regulator
MAHPVERSELSSSADLGVKRASIRRGEGREALCGALVRIVAREGVDGVTFRSVAAEAGVTHGLASYHFKTRDTMINEALTWATRTSIRDSRISRDGGGLDKFASDLPALMGRRPEEAIFQFAVALEALQRVELLPEVRESYDTYIDAVRESLVAFGFPDDPILASVVFATLDGLNLQHLIYSDEERTAKSVDVLRRILTILTRDVSTAESRPNASSAGGPADCAPGPQ